MTVYGGKLERKFVKFYKTLFSNLFIGIWSPIVNGTIRPETSPRKDMVVAQCPAFYKIR